MLERPSETSYAMLKLLLGVALVFLLALALLVLSPLLLMYGLVTDIARLASLSSGLQLLALGLLVATLPLAGTLGLAGITLDSLSSLLIKRKRKRKRQARNSARAAFLASLSREERARLRQRLAAARLMIREDGILVPRENPQSATDDHVDTSCKLHNKK
ncbi:MAG: hypothetical protein OXG92_03365 [Chloroflexi bacterium]|nr:hypothetical protein [Chloroflexota bacterium]MCY3581417.1 hypothetical protein [Chloroflexota bacterium]MCY3715492.1 hypothetical protein [Chloroflexota bacterium]MDE2651223.1 hypothetical protein [Chloroflexota bacterium]MXX49641.1 hypothetical protein [Chloroflexota bacterium]